nr:tubulinyl-Tyr carboxypeptidase 2 isoform X7 [Equus asinus]
MSIPDWLQAIQNYMKTLQYNHTGTQFFEIRKMRPLSGLMETAKEMTRESLPIKCLEAVILGIYLTNGQPSIERFPISFKTYFSGNYFHHVVLGIYCNGRYGSLGMSRRAELMDKPLTFRTLSDLIFDFEDSYKKYLHTVKKVKIGLYVPHEPHSFQPIEWKQLVLNVSKMLRADIRKELEKYARDMRMKILKPASAHSPTQVRSRGKSLSPRRRQASPPRRLGRRDKSLVQTYTIFFVQRQDGKSSSLQSPATCCHHFLVLRLLVASRTPTSIPAELFLSTEAASGWMEDSRAAWPIWEMVHAP